MHSRFHCVNISKFAKKKNKTSYNDGLYPIGLLNSRNMKKIVLAAVILLSSLTPALAQHSVGSISIKPMVGLNIANITDLDDSDPRYGVAAGAEFEYQATDMFSLSFGALYSMQGAKGSLSYKGASVEATCKEDYINIPILANVYVAKGLAVKLGLQPGFNVNDKYHVKAGFAGFSGSGDFDPDEIGMPEAKSVDLSIPVGLSYEYSGFVLDARYNWGVTNLWGDNVDGKNSVFQISLGYKFDL